MLGEIRDAGSVVTGTWSLPGLDDRYVRISGRATRDERSGGVVVHGLAWDVTRVHELERRLAASHQQIQQVIELVPEHVIALDEEDRVAVINATAADRFGARPAELLGANYPDLVHSSGGRDWVVEGTRRVRETGAPWQREDATLLLDDGQRRSLRVHHIPFGADGGATRRVLSVGTDLTDERRATEALRYRALYDPLTGLPNRDLFIDRVRMAIARRRRDADIDVVVLFMDLDGFKQVNDTLGHHVGDELLIGVAERLSNAIRPGDTVARFGGDEFAVLLDGHLGDGHPLRIARRIQEALRPPFMLGERRVTMSASIGVARHVDEQAASDLLRDSDVAMYQAKRLGPGHVRSFEASMRLEAWDDFDLREALVAALEARQLELHYQPVYDAEDRTLRGFEALLRWEREPGVFVPPPRILEIAEATGILVDVEIFVLESALKQAATWYAEQPFGRPVHVGVNVSDVLLRSQRFVSTILDDAVTDVLPWVVLELTETSLIVHPDRTADVLGRVREAGAKIALDDFGTGFSSLSHLAQMPIDVLKLDRSFVFDTGDDNRTAIIARSTVQLAHDLQLTVIAEGVESPEQARHVRDMGCDRIQGWLYGRAEPAAVWDARGESAAIARDAEETSLP